MQAGRLLAAWAGALALVGLVILTTHARLDYQAVLVGTSLTDRALPDHDQEISDIIGATYIKHPHRGIKRYEILNELKMAKRASTKVVFLEVSHFIYRPAWTTPPSNWAREGWWPLRELGFRALAATRVFGLEALAQNGIQRWSPNRQLDLPNRALTAPLDRNFPLHVVHARGYDRLVGSVIDLQEAGAEVILLLQPFSEHAATHMGEEAFQNILANAQTLSDTTSAKLYAHVNPWPDTLYTDSFHLSRAGREKFRGLFADWLRANRGVARDG